MRLKGWHAAWVACVHDGQEGSTSVDEGRAFMMAALVGAGNSRRGDQSGPFQCRRSTPFLIIFCEAW
jgi:hypothetical protein